MRDITFKAAIENAQALKNLGNEEIYLGRDADEKPWALVTNAEPSGSHRMEISTSVRFSAMDPETGLKFHWIFDIEPYSANGKSTYEIDVHGCRDVLGKLPPKAKEQFSQYLKDCAAKVQGKADEYQRVADSQKRDADLLASITA